MRRRRGWTVSEEPLPAEDLGGHIRLAAQTTLPVAVGESIYSISHFREYLQRGGCSVVQVDVARIGAITRTDMIIKVGARYRRPSPVSASIGTGPRSIAWRLPDRIIRFDDARPAGD